MHPVDLETVVGRELRRLPHPRAPHTLLPRVLAAVQAWTLRPWYERAWFTWPLEGRVASIAALILLALGSIIVLPNVQAAVMGMAAAFGAPVASRIAAVLEGVKVATTAAQVLWRAVIEPLAPYVFAFVMLMWLACAAFGTALDRVILGKALQP